MATLAILVLNHLPRRMLHTPSMNPLYVFITLSYPRYPS
jgi:hypothetical protein